MPHYTITIHVTLPVQAMNYPLGRKPPTTASFAFEENGPAFDDHDLAEDFARNLRLVLLPCSAAMVEVIEHPEELQSWAPAPPRLVESNDPPMH